MKKWQFIKSGSRYQRLNNRMLFILSKTCGINLVLFEGQNVAPNKISIKKWVLIWELFYNTINNSRSPCSLLCQRREKTLRIRLLKLKKALFYAAKLCCSGIEKYGTPSSHHDVLLVLFKNIAKEAKSTDIWNAKLSLKYTLKNKKIQKYRRTKLFTPKIIWKVLGHPLATIHDEEVPQTQKQKISNRRKLDWREIHKYRTSEIRRFHN